MPIVLFSGLILGLVASRFIVSEADAHRRHGGNGWTSPTCGLCGGVLTPSMLRCSTNRHRQRFGNAAVVVLSPSLVMLAGLFAPSLWLWPAFGVFSLTLLLLTVTDLDTKLIPNRILGPGTALSAVILTLGWLIDTDSGSLVRAGGGAVAFFAAMYLLAILARGGLGFGDVKLAFLIGLFAGYVGWGVVLIAGVGAFLVGGVVSVVLLVSGRFGRKDAIPFGPFLTSAGIIAVFWGDAIVAWYAG
jgi:leader peptidase (prepilin peptidase)/N-methyltransferase